jgi:YVTN family beta-propeller protein
MNQNMNNKRMHSGIIGAAVFLCLLSQLNCRVLADTILSPTATCASKNGQTVYAACATAGRVLSLDTASQKVLSSIKTPESPSGLALSPDEKWLYVTCASPESRVCVIDLAKHKTVATLSAGHTAMAPVVSKDGRTLYVCNQFNNDVSVFDLEKRVETGRIPVQREPVAVDLTLDGKYLLVANHLPAGRADVENVSAVVSVIDLQAKRVTQELSLPSGSGMLKDLRVSPDGNYAAVTHIFASFLRAANRVDKGWMNANALTVIDLKTMRPFQTILLDTPQRGAANPGGKKGQA